MNEKSPNELHGADQGHLLLHGGVGGVELQSLPLSRSIPVTRDRAGLSTPAFREIVFLHALEHAEERDQVRFFLGGEDDPKTDFVEAHGIQ